MTTDLTTGADTFARLFEGVHEGVYIGTIAPGGDRTLSANPYLKLMFGFSADTPQEDVRPFEADRFVDLQARESFVERLERDRTVSDYLLRLRRADRVPIWVEVTARSEPDAGGGLRVEALMRDVSERKRRITGTGGKDKTARHRNLRARKWEGSRNCHSEPSEESFAG